MKKFFTGLAVLGALLLAAQVYGQMGMMGRGGMMGMSGIRHRYVMEHGINPKYASKINPLPMTAMTIKAGEGLYEQNCARCHGPTGLGNGPDGRTLNPPPSNLVALSRMPMATDGYLYWTIAEGGVPLGTAMPAYKGVLNENQIWEIITYLRTL
ncbi:MAG TPA: cytochrome c [Desulfobaccales bacterium]|nr:cytochrome c [Desulfobaccales bacterium]